MLNIQNNPSAAFRVRWPKTDAEIISVSSTFIAYESSLPAEQQLKDLPVSRIQAAHTSALAGVTGSGDGESTRAEAAEILRQKYELARTELETAISHLKFKYRANLAQLERWGLQTVVRPQGIVVHKPYHRTAWLAFLHAYVTREASLPVAEQLTVPALAQMQALNTDIRAALLARESGRTIREVGVQGRSAATQELDDLLRVACTLIVTTRFNGEITNELQRWGFLVQARPVPGGNGNGTPSGTPPEGMPTPA